jgi:hypothetical protein
VPNIPNQIGNFIVYIYIYVYKNKQMLVDAILYSVEFISSLGCSVISVAFYYLCGYFSSLMPYWL